MRAYAATGIGSVGAVAALCLLVPSEAGVPVGVPADLLMFLVGERAAAGSIPIWVAVAGLEVAALAGTVAMFLAVAGPLRAAVVRVGRRVGLTQARLDKAADVLRRRGKPGLVIGRLTPGLRTLTVVAAAAGGMPARRALPALALGSTVFVQVHFALGYVLGEAASDALEQARGPALVAIAALLVVTAIVWIVRRGRRAGVQAWTEASCPACLAVAALTARVGRADDLRARD